MLCSASPSPVIDVLCEKYGHFCRVSQFLSRVSSSFSLFTPILCFDFFLFVRKKPALSVRRFAALDLCSSYFSPTFYFAARSIL